MNVSQNNIETMPVVRDLADFPRDSGNLLERAVFNHRAAVMWVCVLLTLVLGFFASRVTLNASFEKMIPVGHPYIQNYLQHRAELRGMGNTLRVVVENTQGDIFDPRYIDALKRINDDLFLTPGVDRAWMKSLWTPAVRWTEVTEEGFQGGAVMPDSFDGSAASVAQLRANIARAALVGNLVANDFKSSAVVMPLLERGADGKRLDYWALSRDLETQIRDKYEHGLAPDGKPWGVKVHVIGFAKIVGDLLDGLLQVMLYFGAAIVIAGLLLYGYTRCLRSTALVLGCSLVAVVWQVGLVALLGLELDPYSMLVPFLVFAIGVSHGAQKMNGIMQDIARGTHRLVAARYTFRRLFLAGVTALLADAVGFAVLVLIPIPVIRELALTASIGVAVLVFTNLLLLPVLLSYVGVSPTAAARSLQDEQRQQRGEAGAMWRWLNRFAERRAWALGAIGVSVLLGVAGFAMSLKLQVGDLDPGAPELRADSRYNRDNAFVTRNYSLSSDVFAVIVRTPKEGCLKYDTLQHVDRLAWQLQQLPQVQATLGLQDVVRQITAGSFEGNPKWLTISRNQDVLNYGAQQATVNNPELFNTECSVMPLIAYLSDHKADTLSQVLSTVERFNAANPTDPAQLQVLPAAGPAGIEAATNIVVRQAWVSMLLYVYAAVVALCFITFRSWRAVLVAVLPLVLTSILCEALMVLLGIGVKVATLPVIALGVGIGVDYALYLLSVQLAGQRRGLSLARAYGEAVMFTGRVVALVGVTLAAGVVTWAFSPIKFQADMGILLTFMFLWNMVGALVLIPALSYLLLNDRHVRVPGRDAPAGAPAAAPRLTEAGRA
jgi:predicted RND superfamily exporter protein